MMKSLKRYKTKSLKYGLLSTALLVPMIMSGAQTASALVSGSCVSCHTMHNSQDGADVNASGPFGQLLNNSCVGCHTTATNGGVDIGVGGNTVPYIIITGDTAPSSPDAYLPGGYILTTGADATKHNVLDVNTGQDTNMTDFAPPGYDTTLGTSLGLPATTGAWTQLTCAGSMGCHGDHAESDQSAAVRGIHHDAKAVGFRGLDGINGIESVSYEWGTGAGTNNRYAAKDGNLNYTSKTTISYFCGECHGLFHGNNGDSADGTTNSGGAWIRHPSDYALATAGTGPSGDAYNAFHGNAQVPVGLAAAESVLYISTDGGAAGIVNSSSGTSTGIVLCISCHYSHGSSHTDILRWNYSGMDAGGGSDTTGCFACHSKKDGV
ncbi:MAG: cytochrome c3 family protein [Thermodesulfobacteriota bacterium]|nr:cytochrome c3 family protein [Thermodesulfobacteriota bacterium]